MRKVVLASPMEPSGVTWLINCLLELGICCYRHSVSHMWKQRGDKSFLHPRETVLHRWLPALYRYQTEGFQFQPGLEVQWTHDWPRHCYSNNAALLFVRDPRDALFSRYKRSNAQLSFADYSETPDSQTLLNRVDNWSLFVRSWYHRGNVTVVRFEDYKKQAHDTLRDALSALGIQRDEKDIDRAVEESDYTKARDAEQRYLKDYPEQATVVINRAGQVGSWQMLTAEDKHWCDKFETRGADMLSLLGYSEKHVKTQPIDFSEHVSKQPYLGDVDIQCTGGKPEICTDSLQRFSQELRPGFFEKSGLEPGEAAALVYNLRDYLSGENLALPVDFKTAVEYYRSREADHYVELFKRTKQWRFLSRIGMPTLFRRGLGKVERWLK